MPTKIRPDNNSRSSNLPVDDEVEAAIVTGYVFDSVTGEWVPAVPQAQFLDNRYGGGKTPVVATVVASGNTIIHNPAPGNAVRLFWISAITDPDETNSPLIKVFIGALECYRVYALAHWEVFEGAADEDLIINLSHASNVAVTAHVEEFTP